MFAFRNSNKLDGYVGLYFAYCLTELKSCLSFFAVGVCCPKVDANVHRLSAVLVFCGCSAWNRSRLKLLMMKLQITFNRIPSARTTAEKRFVVDVYSVSQHSRKPLLAVVLVRLLQF